MFSTEQRQQMAEALTSIANGCHVAVQDLQRGIMTLEELDATVDELLAAASELSSHVLNLRAADSE